MNMQTETLEHHRIAALFVEEGGAYFGLPHVPAVVARMGLKRAKRLGEVGARGGGTDSTPRIHTPPEFRELLLQIAATAKRHHTL